MAFPITGRLSSLSITNGSLEQYLTTAAPQSKVKQQIDEFTVKIDQEKKAHQSSWTISTVTITCIALTAIGIGIFYILTHTINEKVICIGGSLIEGGVAVEILFHYFAKQHIKNYNGELDQRLDSFKNQRAYLLPVLEDLDDKQCEEVLKAVTDDEFVHFVDKEVNLDYPQAFRKVLSLSIDRLVRLKRVHVALKFMLNANMTSQECAQIIGKLKAENYAIFIKEFEKTFFANDRELTVAAQNVFDAIITAHLNFIDKKIKVGPLGLRFLENHNLKKDDLIKIINGCFGTNEFLEKIKYVNSIYLAASTRYFTKEWLGNFSNKQIILIVDALKSLDDKILANVSVSELHIVFHFILILTKADIFGPQYSIQEAEKFHKTFQTMPTEIRQLFNSCLGQYRKIIGYKKDLEDKIHIRKIWGDIFKFYREHAENFSHDEWRSVISATNLKGLAGFINTEAQSGDVEKIKKLVLFFYDKMDQSQQKEFLSAKNERNELILREDFIFEIFYSVFNEIGTKDLVKRMETDQCLLNIKMFYDMANFRSLFVKLVLKVPFVYNERHKDKDLANLPAGAFRLIAELFFLMDGTEQASVAALVQKENPNKAGFLQKYVQAKQAAHSL